MTPRTWYSKGYDDGKAQRYAEQELMIRRLEGMLAEARKLAEEWRDAYKNNTGPHQRTFGRIPDTAMPWEVEK